MSDVLMVSIPALAADQRALISTGIALPVEGILPAPLNPGVKMWLYFLAAVVREYNKHRTNIAGQVPGEVITVMDFLSATLDLLEALNPPGPY